MAIKRPTEIPTIDVILVTVKTYDDDTEYALDTANQIGVDIETEDQDRIALIVKRRLIAQKPPTTVLLGNTITLTDNVFSPELIQMFQGGTIHYDATDTDKIIGYTPPLTGSDLENEGKLFMLTAYSTIYNEAGVIVGYEKIEYPNCQAVPVSVQSEDDVFRVTEYTINSAPAFGEAPYTIEWVDELPEVESRL